MFVSYSPGHGGGQKSGENVWSPDQSKSVSQAKIRSYLLNVLPWVLLKGNLRMNISRYLSELHSGDFSHHKTSQCKGGLGGLEAGSTTCQESNSMCLLCKSIFGLQLAPIRKDRTPDSLHDMVPTTLLIIALVTFKVKMWSQNPS